MATSNRDRVGAGASSCSPPALSRSSTRTCAASTAIDWAAAFVRQGPNPSTEHSTRDPSFLLIVMIERWDHVFRPRLPGRCASLIFELRDTRNHWAHNEAFKPD